MNKREMYLWIIVIFMLVINLFSSYIFTRTIHAQQGIFKNVALSAGHGGVVYFYDGTNLFFSNNYGIEWRKVR